MAGQLVKEQFIAEHIDIIRLGVVRLGQLVHLGEEAFLAEPDHYAIAEHHLRRSLQAMLDIGNHIVAKLALGRPDDYRSILRLLGQNNIIPAAFAKHIEGMAGYRNRLVHGYARVTPVEMYRLLSERLDDLVEFSRHVYTFVSKGSH